MTEMFRIRGVEPDLLLRALTTVALADGALDARERALLDAAAGLLERDAGRPPDPIAPDALAASITVPAARERVMAMLVAMALADGEASVEEARVLASFRFALGVDDDRVDLFQKLAERQLQHVRYELLRRRQQPDAGDWRALYASLSLTKAAAVEDRAARLESLRPLPADTLGGAVRALYDAAGVDGLDEPPEELRHDFLHALTGYGLDAAGEIELGAFESGLSDADPTGPLFMAMVQFNAGVQLRAGGRAGRGGFDAARASRAFGRGREADPSLRAWEPWPDREAPLDALRARFGLL